MNPATGYGRPNHQLEDWRAEDGRKTHRERKVTIIILTWNGLQYTKRCLATLIETTNFSNYEILVADNGSTDGTLEFLQSHGSIRLLSFGSNLGFARANNLAIAEADPCSDIVLLNNDTEIIQSDWLDKLQALAQRDRKSVV